MARKKKNTGGQLEFNFDFDEIAASMQKMNTEQKKANAAAKAQIALDRQREGLLQSQQKTSQAIEKTNQEQLKTKRELLKNQEKEIGIIEKANKVERVRLNNSFQLLKNEQALVALKQQKEKLKIDKQNTKEYKAGEETRAAKAAAELERERLKNREIQQRMDIAMARENDRQTDRAARQAYNEKRDQERAKKNEEWEQEKKKREKEEKIREYKKKLKDGKENFGDIKTLISPSASLRDKFWAGYDFYARNPSIWSEDEGGSKKKEVAAIAGMTVLGLFTKSLGWAVKIIKIFGKFLLKAGLALGTLATTMAIGAFKGASSTLRTGDIGNMRYGDILAAQMGGKLNGLGEDGLISMIKQQGLNINNISSTGAYATVGLNREDLSKLNGIDRFFYTMDAFIERTNMWGEHATKALAPDLGLDWETVQMFRNNPEMYDRLKKDTMTRAQRYGGMTGKGLEEGERIIKQFHEQLKLLSIEISGKLLPVISLALSEAAPIIRSFMNGFADLVNTVFTKENIRKLRQSFDDLRKEMSNAWKKIFDQQTMDNIRQLGEKLGGIGKDVKGLVFTDNNYAWVKDQINKVITSFKEIDWDNFKPMFKKLGGIIQEIVNVITSAFDTFLKGVELFAALFSLDPERIKSATEKFIKSGGKLVLDIGEGAIKATKIALGKEDKDGGTATDAKTDSQKAEAEIAKKKARAEAYARMASKVNDPNAKGSYKNAQKLLTKNNIPITGQLFEGLYNYKELQKKKNTAEYMIEIRKWAEKYSDIAEFDNKTGAYGLKKSISGDWLWKGMPTFFDEMWKKENVDDGVITKEGKVIKTNPEDYIFATKHPENLAKAGGNGNIVINVGSVRDDRDINEIRRVVDRLVRQMNAMRI